MNRNEARIYDLEQRVHALEKLLNKTVERLLEAEDW